jgi:hypothetical protein
MVFLFFDWGWSCGCGEIGFIVNYVYYFCYYYYCTADDDDISYVFVLVFYYI